MAKKSTVTEIKEEVEVVEEAKVEAPTITEIKTRTIIANAPTAFRKTANLENKYVVSLMPTGIAYEIEKEVSNKIYGSFYKLKNGFYITKDGNYTLN